MTARQRYLHFNHSARPTQAYTNYKDMLFKLNRYTPHKPRYKFFKLMSSYKQNVIQSDVINRNLNAIPA